jgi:hypothetical protein
MARRAALRQQDLTRALRAVQAAGFEIAQIEIEIDGRIALIIRRPVGNIASPSEDDLDRELAEFENDLDND